MKKYIWLKTTKKNKKTSPKCLKNLLRKLSVGGHGPNYKNAFQLCTVIGSSEFGFFKGHDYYI